MLCAAGRRSPHTETADRLRGSTSGGWPALAVRLRVARADGGNAAAAAAAGWLQRRDVTNDDVSLWRLTSPSSQTGWLRHHA